MQECDAILMSIRRIARAVDRHSKQLVRISGLSVPHLLVMHAVRRRGSAPTGLIAKEVCQSQGSVTAIIDRLESQGFLQRDRSTADRRIVHVSLTATGQQKLDESPKLIQPDFICAFLRLDSWEQQMIVSTLDRIARMLNADESGPVPKVDIGVEALAAEE